MPLYSIGLITSAPLSDSPFLLIHTGANRVRLKQIEISLATAVASSVGLVRPITTGTVTPTPSVGQPYQTQDVASLTAFETAWSVAPTKAGSPVYLKRASIGGVVGNGVVWTFPEPVIIEATSGLLLWNFGGGAGAQLNVNALYDE